MSEPPPAVTTLQGLHPEMLTTAIRDASIVPCQLDSQPALSHLGRLNCPTVCLDFATFGPSMLFTGEMSRHCFTLIFVLACPEKGRSFNFSTEHTDGYMGFFPPGSLLDAMTPKRYANATLTIPADAFRARLKTHFPEIPGSILTHGAAMRVGPAEQAALRELLAAAEDTMMHNPDALSAAVHRRHIEKELIQMFLAAMRSGCEHIVAPPGLRVGGRLRRIREARDFLEARLHSPVHLDDLAGALGLTHRGVEILFRDLLGVPPVAYLRQQRLHGARRALLATTPGTGLVKQVALDWGFWHFGRFARDYRELFGESPSATLARPR